jgi:hypothetical protein
VEFEALIVDVVKIIEEEKAKKWSIDPSIAIFP